MHYKNIFFFAVFLIINTTTHIHAMEQNQNIPLSYTREEINAIVQEINYNRNFIIKKWINGDIDPFNLNSPMPCSPFQTTPNHVILLLENKKESIIKTKNPKLVDITLASIEKKCEQQ